jgi:hypothetical protein
MEWNQTGLSMQPWVDTASHLNNGDWCRLSFLDVRTDASFCWKAVYLQSLSGDLYNDPVYTGNTELFDAPKASSSQCPSARRTLSYYAESSKLNVPNLFTDGLIWEGKI